MKPLEGIVVLDLTHMLSGPYGTMILTDLGARTIKVEPPGQGEGTRALLARSPEYSRLGMGAYFLTLNRGKESVAVDLKSDTGLEVFYDLVKQADIVFDNFSVGVTQRLKIDHSSLAAINPRIITCSVSGFGETGPEPNRPAFDQVVQGMGGGMSITGFADRDPVRSGIPIGDLGGGVFGVIGVLAALAERQRTGHGRHVDISMLDAQISLLNYMATMYLMSGKVPERIGNSHFVHVPYNTYRTRTGHIPCAPVNDFAQALSDPQVMARNMVIDVRLQNGEVVRMPGNPVKIGDDPSPETPGAPPMLGEHTETVLRTVLGYDDARMDHLRQNSVIQ